jgi:PAS domain S-box-containing protein
MKHAKQIALKVAITYVILGAAWVLLSDYVSILFAHNKITLYIFFQRYKGWFFILLTGLVIYYLVYKRTNEILEANEKLRGKEQQLAINSQQYQSLFIHNPDAVFEVNQSGKIVAINPEGEKLLGLSIQELQAENISDFFPEQSVLAVRDYYKKALNGKASNFETTMVDFEKKEKILRCSLVPIFIYEEITGVFGIARDITSIRENERMIVASEKLSVIGQLAAGVAHEIRNPLTSLKGFVQLMQGTRTVNVNHLDIMLSEIERIDLISSEMLILGKQQDIPLRQVNLDDVMEQVLVLMNAQANLDNVSIIYENLAEKDLYVKSDANQLKQVFINIVKNSVEAINNKHHGKVTITITKKEPFACITVGDNGVGMEPEKMKKVGEPFYSTKEKGTGLGLAICKKIVERHKGSMEFKSFIGEGTEVDIYLPLSDEKIL